MIDIDHVTTSSKSVSDKCAFINVELHEHVRISVLRMITPDTSAARDESIQELLANTINCRVGPTCKPTRNLRASSVSFCA